MLSALGRDSSSSGNLGHPIVVEAKFKTLRLFAAIQIIVGVLFLISAGIALLAIVGVIAGVNDRDAGLLSGIVGIGVVGVLVLIGIQSIAFGQFLLVVRQIEENTRRY